MKRAIINFLIVSIVGIPLVYLFGGTLENYSGVVLGAAFGAFIFNPFILETILKRIFR